MEQLDFSRPAGEMQKKDINSFLNKVQQKAQEIHDKIADKLDYIGVLAIEFFQMGDELLVNEIAPRTHNSGHQSIEGNITSQFEQHLRSICGLPLGETSIIQPTVMVNILGEDGFKGLARLNHEAACKAADALNNIIPW